MNRLKDDRVDAVLTSAEPTAVRDVQSRFRRAKCGRHGQAPWCVQLGEESFRPTPSRKSFAAGHGHDLPCGLPTALLRFFGNRRFRSEIGGPKLRQQSLHLDTAVCLRRFAAEFVGDVELLLEDAVALDMCAKED